MKKLLEFGRKAMFYVRVLSGYEERRIRSYRLKLQKHLQQSEEKKAALKKIPEQMILSEVRCMVEEMQALNKKLEETEAAIEDHFKPIDKEAEIIMKVQLDGEEKTMREMVKAMQARALLEKAEADRIAAIKNAEANQHVQEKTSASTAQVEVR
ncbi:hypothetical protein CEY00_Acc16710 [Actinidia chinensis var. chinensis]|uniref:Uncharacterized protein n=1 Tax=Actinidia chinensis var. chinensis TaxID=1590841 RepID=A0A2R6QJZ1_ACTCC|nr:hypothetical protein CEY00_Acc16710 [Actinidia chinensis var. chinensis]